MEHAALVIEKDEWEIRNFHLRIISQPHNSFPFIDSYITNDFFFFSSLDSNLPLLLYKFPPVGPNYHPKFCVSSRPVPGGGWRRPGVGGRVPRAAGCHWSQSPLLLLQHKRWKNLNIILSHWRMNIISPVFPPAQNLIAFRGSRSRCLVLQSWPLFCPVF